MGYTYRTSGPWGVGKGSNLTPAEVDGNVWQAVQDIAAKAAQGVGIANIIVTGNQLTFTLTDHTILGPFTLPTASFKFRGNWLANTSYFVNDIVDADGGVYMVLFNHTSDSIFDPGANDGLGHDYYGLLLEAATPVFNYRGDWETVTLYNVNDIVTHFGSTYLVLRNHTSDTVFDADAVDGSGFKLYGILAAALPTPWDFGFAVATAPNPGDVVQTVPITRNIRIEPDMLGSVGVVDVPPDDFATVDMTVDNDLVGTITAHAFGSYTFSTLNNHPIFINAGSIVRFVWSLIDSPIGDANVKGMHVVIAATQV